MAPASLRASVEHGNCPFGLGWLKKKFDEPGIFCTDINILPVGNAGKWISRGDENVKHINEAIVGLSFLGLLSASGYAEMDKLPMGGYTVLAALLLGVMLISVRSLVKHYYEEN